VGLLVKCPQCNKLFAKGDICPICGLAEDEAATQRVQKAREEYRKRKALSETNYAIYVGLMIGLIAVSAGLIGIGWITEAWLRIPYTARLVGAEVLQDTSPTLVWLTWIGIVLGVIWVVLAFLVATSGNWWSTAVLCPECNFRLDGKKEEPTNCPSCSIRIR
jgi:hypothetical protein